MRSKKLCSILLSALFIMLGLSLNVCLDTNAKQYDIVSVPYFSPYLPYSSVLDSNTGNYVIDWANLPSAINGSNYFTPDLDSNGHSLTFSLSCGGNCYYSDLNSLYLNSSLSFVGLNYNSSTQNCDLGSNPVSPLLSFSSTSTSLSIRARSNYTFPQIPSQCYHNNLKFGESPQPPFSGTSSSLGYLTCGRSNGAVCDGIWDYRNYINNIILPYPYSSNGFYTKSSAIDSSSGIHYDHSFRFSDLFNQNIKRFSSLTIPLYTYDDFWFDGNNFTENRHLEFNGIFKFTGSFSLNPNISTNGAFLRVRLIGGTSSGSTEQFIFNCSNRNIGIETGYQFEYSCSGDLPQQFIWLLPVLQFYGGSTDGNSDYFWETDSDTIFASSVLITDNDTSPGGRLGDNLTGNYIIGDANNEIQTDDNADWTSSLKNLFNFNMINPFAPIFSLFTSQESCAQIPTLSEFLNSEETQVCPFFSSRIRSVVTPVLGLSAMMLVFGFAVRWLGARSGNFFEDSGSIAPPGDFPAGSAGVKHVGWRRK